MRKSIKKQENDDYDKYEDDRLDQIYLQKQEKKGVERALNAMAESIRKSKANIEARKNKPKVKRTFDFLKTESPKEPEPKPKKQSLLKKKVLKGKEIQVMDAKSTAHKTGDKAYITTDMNVTKGLSPKDKKALKASVMKALDNHIKGGKLDKIHSFLGGMINEGGEVEPEPLVKNRERQTAIESVIEDWKEVEGYDPINLITGEWSLSDAKKRYDALNEFLKLVSLREVDEANLDLDDENDDDELMEIIKANPIRGKKGTNSKSLKAWEDKKDEVLKYLNMKEGTSIKKGRGRPRKTV